MLAADRRRVLADRDVLSVDFRQYGAGCGFSRLIEALADGLPLADVQVVVHLLGIDAVSIDGDIQAAVYFTVQAAALEIALRKRVDRDGEVEFLWISRKFHRNGRAHAVDALFFQSNRITSGQAKGQDDQEEGQ